MRRPRRSKRSLIAPVRLRRVASGLMIDSVRSMAITISCSGEKPSGYIDRLRERQSGRSRLAPYGGSIGAMEQVPTSGRPLATVSGSSLVLSLLVGFGSLLGRFNSLFDHLGNLPCGSS